MLHVHVVGWRSNQVDQDSRHSCDGAYWCFDPKSGTYSPLGTYPIFRVDAQKRRLFTYERGGSAGLIHEAREYAFLKGKLTLMREEKQEATADDRVFRKVIRERSRGTLRTVTTEIVRAPNEP